MHKLSNGVSDADFVKTLDFFCLLQPIILNKIIKVLTPRLIEKEKKVYQVGDSAEEIFILRAGELREEVPLMREDMIKKYGGKKGEYYVFTNLSPGSWFGVTETL